jgi:mannose/fructose-specific phosphotransferase system component IIA
MSDTPVEPVISPAVRDVLAPLVEEVRRLLAEQEAKMKEIARRAGVEINLNIPLLTEAMVWKAIEAAFTDARLAELKQEVYKLVTTGKSKTRKNKASLA